MSWPVDGKPRFVTSIVRGSLGARKARTMENLSAAVLDRAFCHRQVANFRTEEFVAFAGPAAREREAVRRARELCDTLNREQATA